jgi:hypothetical protein
MKPMTIFIKNNLIHQIYEFLIQSNVLKNIENEQDQKYTEIIEK